MEDPALRPVFLVKLDEKFGEIGPMENKNEQAIAEIGGEDILNNISGFGAGPHSAATANRLAKQGKKIIIGVTDRWSADTTAMEVANGRQAYFPLPDGAGWDTARCLS